MTMITPSYLGETIEYSSLHACRSTLEDPTRKQPRNTLGAPVREFTIASTLQRMLLDVAEVGGDLEWLPMRSAGMSLVIHDVTMSGA